MGGGEEKRRPDAFAGGYRIWTRGTKKSPSPYCERRGLLGESDKAQWRHQLGLNRDGGAGVQSNP